MSGSRWAAVCGFVVCVGLIGCGGGGGGSSSTGTTATAGTSATAGTTADAGSTSTAGSTADAGSTSTAGTTAGDGPFNVLLFPVGPTFGNGRITSGASSVAGGYTHPLANPHAMLWPIHGAPIDMHPGSGAWLRSEIRDTDGTQQVGIGVRTSDVEQRTRPVLWSGTQQSALELTPTAYYYAVASGVDGGYQAGYGSKTGSSPLQPLLWHSAPNDFVNLLPDGMYSGRALSISGTVVGGEVAYTNTGPFHTAIWTNRSKESFVDLDGGGFRGTGVARVSGNQQVGFGVLEAVDPADEHLLHAVMWSGTSASQVDLHPVGYDYSTAEGVGAGKQCGAYWNYGGSPKACLWSGSSGSMIDLDQYIPVDHQGSRATAIDEQGNIYGITVPDGRGVVWVPKP